MSQVEPAFKSILESYFQIKVHFLTTFSHINMSDDDGGMSMNFVVSGAKLSKPKGEVEKLCTSKRTHICARTHTAHALYTFFFGPCGFAIFHFFLPPPPLRIALRLLTGATSTPPTRPVRRRCPHLPSRSPLYLVFTPSIHQFLSSQSIRIQKATRQQKENGLRRRNAPKQTQDYHPQTTRCVPSMQA